MSLPSLIGTTRLHTIEREWSSVMREAHANVGHLRLDVPRSEKGSISANYVGYQEGHYTVGPPYGVTPGSSLREKKLREKHEIAPYRPLPPRIVDARWRLNQGRYQAEAAPMSGVCILNPWERTNMEKALKSQVALRDNHNVICSSVVFLHPP